jgi:hypothetical protein
MEMFTNKYGSLSLLYFNVTSIGTGTCVFRLFLWIQTDFSEGSICAINSQNLCAIFNKVNKALNLIQYLDSGSGQQNNTGILKRQYHEIFDLWFFL